MLERLLETGAQRRKSGWGGTASVIVHGAIIGLAIIGTAKAAPPERGGEHVMATLPFHSPVDDPRPGTVGGGQPVGGGRPTVSLPTTAVPGPVDLDVPSPALPGGLDGDTTLLADIGRSDGQPTIATSDGGAFGSDAVDRPVRVLSERAPAYPESLRNSGIAGAVTMQFVIDTAGRVEPASLRVVASSHELFTRAVVTSLRQARFTPGEVAGRHVRTLVERSFRFDIATAR